MVMKPKLKSQKFTHSISYLRTTRRKMSISERGKKLGDIENIDRRIRARIIFSSFIFCFCFLTKRNAVSIVNEKSFFLANDTKENICIRVWRWRKRASLSREEKNPLNLFFHLQQPTMCRIEFVVLRICSNCWNCSFHIDMILVKSVLNFFLLSSPHFISSSSSSPPFGFSLFLTKSEWLYMQCGKKIEENRQLPMDFQSFTVKIETDICGFVGWIVYIWYVYVYVYV